MKKKALISILSFLLIGAFLIPLQASAETLQTTTTKASYGSRYSDNPEDWFADATVTNQINYEMPDLYNTGYVSSYNELVDFGEKYPEVPKATTTKNGVVYTTYTINDTTAAIYNYAFEGFKIEHGSLKFYNSTDNKTEANGGITHNIVVKNFYLNCDNALSVAIYSKRGAEQGRLILLDGDIQGSVSTAITGANITIKRCKVHHVWADHIKGFSGLWMESSYFYDGGLNGGDPHPDCIQFSGDNGHGGGLETKDVYVYGCRFDAQKTSVNTTNACIIFQTEFGAGNRNCKFNNNWFNGGNISVTIGTKASNGQVQPYQEGVEFKDNLFGHGEEYINTFIKFTADTSTGIIRKGTTVTNNEGIIDLIIGSINYLNDGKVVTNLQNLDSSNKSVRVCISNYSQSAKTVVVQVLLVNSEGEIKNSAYAEYDIEAYYTYSQIKEGRAPKSWANFRYEDEPLDLDCSVDISSFNNIEEDCTLQTIVYFENAENALEAIREDTLFYGINKTINSHETIVPAGYLIYTTDENNVNYQFVTLVNNLKNDRAETLRTNILTAYSMLDQVDSAYYGVDAAKETLTSTIASYNNSIVEDNAFHSQAISVSEKVISVVPYAVVISAILGTAVVIILKKEVF